MRQDDNYQGNFNQLFSAGMQERLRSAHVVTDLQRIIELQVSSQKGLCKSTKKKGILKNLLSHREQFLSLAKSLDTAFNSNLHDALERIIPSRTEISKGDNHALSGMILHLFEPLEAFLQFNKQQEGVLSESRCTTRGVSSTNGGASSMTVQIAEPDGWTATGTRV